MAVKDIFGGVAKPKLETYNSPQTSFYRFPNNGAEPTEIFNGVPFGATSTHVLILVHQTTNGWLLKKTTRVTVGLQTAVKRAEGYVPREYSSHWSIWEAPVSSSSGTVTIKGQGHNSGLGTVPYTTSTPWGGGGFAVIGTNYEMGPPNYISTQASGGYTWGVGVRKYPGGLTIAAVTSSYGSGYITGFGSAEVNHQALNWNTWWYLERPTSYSSVVRTAGISSHYYNQGTFSVAWDDPNI